MPLSRSVAYSGQSCPPRNIGGILSIHPALGERVMIAQPPFMRHATVKLSANAAVAIA